MPPGIEDMLVRLIFRDQRDHGRNGRLLSEPLRLDCARLQGGGVSLLRQSARQIDALLRHRVPKPRLSGIKIDERGRDSGLKGCNFYAPGEEQFAGTYDFVEGVPIVLCSDMQQRLCDRRKVG